MEKMLALGTEEALSCARLSPEGDHHDDVMMAIMLMIMLVINLTIYVRPSM